ncbi:unnamed protein product [Rhizoctonia solani]|uniref:Glycoside hydrolase 131 catalytic N-terminal domain-containing protein n=1 Tax=Rhizoctonia solani TaxID=456999 RepID=A0A8H3DIG8_9AGAM|nr:unnamed protein product [Rhizoctonia solani]
MVYPRLTLIATCAVGALATPVLYDGRAPLNYTAANIDAFQPPYGYVVKGSETASKYVSFSTNSPPPTPLWYPKGSNSPVEQTVSVRIDNSSVFVPGNNPANSQWGFRRTEVIAQNNRTMLQSGKTVWHFSIMRDEARPLNFNHEYQIVFAEPDDGSHVFGLKVGSSFTVPTAPTLPTRTARNLEVLDHALNVLYSTSFDLNIWHNFAIQVDWDARTLGVFASKAGSKLKKVSKLVSNNSTKPIPEGRGDFHFGLLKLPLANPLDTPEQQGDVVHRGIQEGTLEGLHYSGVFVETQVDDVSGLGYPDQLDRGARFHRLMSKQAPPISKAFNDATDDLEDVVSLNRLPDAHIKSTSFEKLLPLRGDTPFLINMQTLKNTIAENFGIPGAHQLAKPEHQFALDDVPDLTGKVAVVTGGSEGVGLASATVLLRRGITRLFILSPNPEHAKEAIEFFDKELGASVVDRVTWVPCDLSDWSQTQSVANMIASQIDRLDILLNIAGRGVMTVQRNKDDIDLHMALNHFGHVRTADSGATVRIANAGSNLHQSAPKETTFADIAELNMDYGPNGQYARSKLAAILYARYLARHLSPTHPRILTNAFHPGVVDTRQSNQHIHEPYPVLGWGNNALYPLKKDIWDGAVSVMYVATKTESTGQYICPPAIPEAGSDLVRNDALGEQLMALTKQILKSKAQIDLDFY